MIILRTKVQKASYALMELVHAVNWWKECQHGIVFQTTNPSLSFEYEFERKGKEMEMARVRLKKAIEAAEEAQAELGG